MRRRGSKPPAPPPPQEPIYENLRPNKSGKPRLEEPRPKRAAPPTPRFNDGGDGLERKRSFGKNRAAPLPSARFEAPRIEQSAGTGKLNPVREMQMMGISGRNEVSKSGFVRFQSIVKLILLYVPARVGLGALQLPGNATQDDLQSGLDEALGCRNGFR